MRISISRHTLQSVGAVSLLAAGALILTAPPAAAEGYMSGERYVTGQPHLINVPAHRIEEADAREAQRSAEPRELSGWTRMVFFQGQDPDDREAVKRLGTHPGAAGM